MDQLEAAKKAIAEEEAVRQKADNEDFLDTVMSFYIMFSALTWLLIMVFFRSGEVAAGTLACLFGAPWACVYFWRLWPHRRERFTLVAVLAFAVAPLCVASVLHATPEQPLVLFPDSEADSRLGMPRSPLGWAIFLGGMPFVLAYSMVVLGAMFDRER